MAELHKFQDAVRSEENRSKPVVSRYLDENFIIVRLKISTGLASLFKISENSPKSDELDLNVAATGSFIVTVQNGSITLVPAPTSSTQFFSSTSGTLGFTDSEECPP